MSSISGEKDHYYYYHYYYYLSDLSRDWVAPKGIACTRVLPTTQIQHNTNTELSHITDTANKAQNKKHITGNHKKKNLNMTENWV